MRNSILLLAGLFYVASPLYVFAQENPPRAIIVDQNQTYQPAGLTNSQAQAGNQNSTGMSFQGQASGAGVYVTSCLAAGGVTSAIKGSVAKAVSSFTNVLEVPTADNSQRLKETGLEILGVNTGISWDQIGWCLINSVIASIGDATVAWINGGFQGNPVFVEDPGQFFSDIADLQAGMFLGEISNGFLCGPIQNIVRVNLATNYNNGLAPYGSCTFSAISGNLESFMSGQSGFNWIDWQSYTQNPYNNPYGATIAGQIQLDNRIASSLGIQSTLLTWGRGFLSSTDPKTGKIVSPGSVIETQVNTRLGTGQRRLEIADEFDEIVDALVGQLVRVAISEMTQQSGSY